MERVKSIVNHIVNCKVNPVWGRFTLDFTIYSWPPCQNTRALKSRVGLYTHFTLDLTLYASAQDLTPIDFTIDFTLEIA